MPTVTAEAPTPPALSRGKPPPVIRKGAGPHQVALWSKPRKEAEEIYVEAFRRDDRTALRWLACHDRYFLLTCLLQRGDARSDWLYDRCREVEANPDDCIDLWAREHYKSTIITFAGVIQEILKDPEITVGIFSHDRPAAKAFMKQIKEELEKNELLKGLFPDILWPNPKKQAVKWSEDEGIVVRRKSNPKESTLEAWGLLDGMPTGKHFRLRVYDDIVTEERVTNPEMIKKTTERWELSDNLGTRDGRIWIIGTRYHFADTYAVLIQRGVFAERRHAATHDGTFDGKPVFLTQAQWDRKKATISKSTIASQQLLNPLQGAETKFDVRWIQFWHLRPKRLNVYIMGDPSKGRHATSDNTAIAVVGVDAGRNKYLLDGYRHRMTLSRRWQVLRDLWKRWSAMAGVESVFVGYEQFGLQTDIEYFEERMLTEKIAFPIEELAWPREGKTSKTQRIERMEPDFRMGRIRLPGVVEIDDEGKVSNVDPRQVKDKDLREHIDAAVKSGEAWRVAKRIIQKNEDGHVYDVLLALIEEYSFFPFAPRDDFLDALSRIYDMEPAPPVYYGPDPNGNLPTEPEVFIDGV